MLRLVIFGFIVARFLQFASAKVALLALCALLAVADVPLIRWLKSAGAKFFDTL